ncbi:MAG TPA: hypothetical protein VFA49_11995, partial [Chloroflexota bacterium]|nr:hypothetical protein [Chloroflexota bacterium]
RVTASVGGPLDSICRASACAASADSSNQAEDLGLPHGQPAWTLEQSGHQPNDSSRRPRSSPSNHHLGRPSRHLTSYTA